MTTIASLFKTQIQALNDILGRTCGYTVLNAAQSEEISQIALRGVRAYTAALSDRCTPMQQLVLDLYGRAEITSKVEALDAGDTLLLFLIGEMEELETHRKQDRGTAVKRLRRAGFDLLALADNLEDALKQLPAEEPADA